MHYYKGNLSEMNGVIKQGMRQLCKTFKQASKQDTHIPLYPEEQRTLSVLLHLQTGKPDRISLAP